MRYFFTGNLQVLMKNEETVIMIIYVFRSRNK
jgi:hypothetical protein